MKFIKSKSTAGFTQLEKLNNNNLVIKVVRICKKLLNFKKNNLSVSLTGFTLLETIIYLAIVGIVISAVVDFAITMGNTTAKMSANIDASRNRRFALATINYLVRNADGLLKDVNGDCSNFSVNPPILALYFEDDNYLPGVCVERGGGVKITVVNNRLKMTCYPNITNNGQYNACTATADETYFLSGPEVLVTNSNLDFTTSTASTTANSYNTITTHLKVTLPSADQISLRASSEATSTANMRNEQANGLISWYKFDDAVTSSAVDSVGANNLTCGPGSPISVPGLIDGSDNAFQFVVYEDDKCYVNNPDNLNFNSSFTISTWVKSLTDSDTTHYIVFKGNEVNKGYVLRNFETSGDVFFDLCNGTTCSTILEASGFGYLAAGFVFNITVVYDKPSDRAQMFIYKKGVGGISTTTAAVNLPFLVNDSSANYPHIGQDFDGVIDDLRIYNRALSNSEVWALQSQGAN